MEKQIEEMARELCHTMSRIKHNDCHKCFNNNECRYQQYAEILTKQGYRKDNEVERLHKELLEKDIDKANEVYRLNAYIEALEYELDQAKQEVAREIFEEVEKPILSQLGTSTMEKKEAYCFCLDTIAELRKQYIGE